MKKSMIVVLHIGFWFCYFIMLLVMLAMFFQDDDAMESRIETAFETMFFFAIVPSSISFYAFYLVLFPKYLQKRKIFTSIIYGILISLGAGLVGYLILNTLYGPDCGVEETTKNVFIPMVLFMGFIAFISGIIALVIKGFITWYGEIKVKEVLQEKNHQMELALVKSQLDPHFLFNTLNNIDILILKNPEEASTYLNKLSDIMRFMLFETKTNKITLSKEVEYIEKYIELQKIRTSNTHYINYTLTGDIKGKTIAPMVFIPFIENAFKHTTNKKLDNAITINIKANSSNIQLECINKLDSSRSIQQESHGLGNELIQKRLNLLYPNQHTLKIVPKPNLYSVFLTIQHD